MKKISFIILSLLTAQVSFAMETGSPDSRPYTYTPLLEALRAHPLIKGKLDALNQQEQEIVTNLELSEEQKQQYLKSIKEQQDELITSVLSTSQQFTQSTEDQAATTSDEQSEPQTTSGLSLWASYQLWRYGEIEALQYLRDNNEFDKNNTDHIGLLNSNIRARTQKENDIYATYEQSVQNIKATHCYTMVALLTQAHKNLSDLEAQLKAHHEEQQNQKASAYQQFKEAYNANREGINQLSTDMQQHNITDPAVQNSFDKYMTQMLEGSNNHLVEFDFTALMEKTDRALTRLANCKKSLAHLPDMFALENNTQSDK